MPEQFDINKLRVASPCPVAWDAMSGSDRKRHCDLCKLYVYNISEMSRPEVANLMDAHVGRLCVRLYRRSDGSVSTKDCPVGIRAYQRRVARLAGATLSAILGLFSISFAQKDEEKVIDAQKAKITKTKGATDKYAIQGTLTDPNGAVIPGFEITLFKKDERKPGELELVATATSDACGMYGFSGISTGFFVIRVKAKSGFQALRVENIKVESGKLSGVDLTLYPSARGVVVGMLADDTPIDVGSNTTQTVTTSEMIDRLPH